MESRKPPSHCVAYHGYARKETDEDLPKNQEAQRLQPCGTTRGVSMTKLRLPINVECQQCEAVIPAQTLLFEEQGRLFCSEEEGFEWRRFHRQSRTNRILDLCSQGYGLKEAVALAA